MATNSHSINRKILSFTLFLVILSSLLISYFSIDQFEKKLTPEIHNKSKIIGESINKLIIKHVKIFPFQKINTKQHFINILDANKEIKYLSINDLNGEVLHHHGKLDKEIKKYFKQKNVRTLNTYRYTLISKYHNSSLPIKINNKLLGTLHLGITKEFVQDKLKEMYYDILTVIVITFLVAFQLVVFFVAHTVSAPMTSLNDVLSTASKGNFSKYLSFKSKDEIGKLIALYNETVSKINNAYYTLVGKIIHLSKFEMPENILKKIDLKYKFGNIDKPIKFTASNLAYIRPALFLLIFSESFSISFFPLYVDELYSVNGVLSSWLSKEIIIGLPISIFMLFWALSLVPSGSWSDRIGRRKPFIVGAIITAIGLTSTGLATNIYDLLIIRAITAIGYGIVFISSQGYVIDNTSPDNRSRGMALFLSGFFAGALAGSAIGGILANHIGYKSTFFVSGVLSLISAIFVYYFLYDQNIDTKKAKKKFKFTDLTLLFSNREFLVLTLFIAIPAKICLVGFIYLTVPQYLKSIDINQADIGRAIMAYGLAMIIGSPIIAKLADKIKNRKVFIIIGTFIAGGGLLIVYFWPNNIIGVIICIFLVGLGHAIAVSSQLTLITEICRPEGKKIGIGTVVGMFRLLERTGNIIGPIVMGYLISYYQEPALAITALGIMTLTGSGLFAFMFIVFDFKKSKIHPHTIIADKKEKIPSNIVDIKKDKTELEIWLDSKIEKITELYNDKLVPYYDIYGNIKKRLKVFIIEAKDEELYRVNIYQLSNKLNIDKKFLLTYLYYSNKVELFDMEVLVHCAYCNCVTEVHSHLTDLKPFSYCELCDNQFSVLLDELIEVVFTINQEVKKLSNYPIYIIPEQIDKKIDLTLKEGESFISKAFLEQGEYIYLCPFLLAKGTLTSGKTFSNDEQSLEIKYTKNNFSSNMININQGPVEFVIENNSDENIGFILFSKKTSPLDISLMPKRLSGLDLIHIIGQKELFSNKTIKGKVGVNDLTILYLACTLDSKKLPLSFKLFLEKVFLELSKVFRKYSGITLDIADNFIKVSFLSPLDSIKGLIESKKILFDLLNDQSTPLSSKKLKGKLPMFYSAINVEIAYSLTVTENQTSLEKYLIWLTL